MKYYAIQSVIRKLIKENDTVEKLSKRVGIPKQIIFNMIEDVSVTKTVVDKFCKEFNLKITDMFEEDSYKPIDERDLTNVKLSEQIIIGLMENVRQKLVLNNNKRLTKEIMDIVGDIVIEATYFGVIVQKEKKADFVQKAILKRRS